MMKKTTAMLVLGTIVIFAGSAGADEIQVKMLNKGEKGMMVFEPDFVRAVEPFAFVFVGQRADFAVLLRDRNSPLTAGVSPFGSEEPPLAIENQSVGASAGIAIDLGLFRLGIEAVDAVADVGEVNLPIAAEGGTFGEFAFAPNDFELRLG